jgi:hypothetical protein
MPFQGPLPLSSVRKTGLRLPQHHPERSLGHLSFRHAPTRKDEHVS